MFVVLGEENVGVPNAYRAVCIGGEGGRAGGGMMLNACFYRGLDLLSARGNTSMHCSFCNIQADTRNRKAIRWMSSIGHASALST